MSLVTVSFARILLLEITRERERERERERDENHDYFSGVFFHTDLGHGKKPFIF